MAKTTNPTPPSDDSNNSDRDADTDRDAETDTDVSNGQISNVQRGDLNDTSSSADDTAILPTVLPTEQIPADPTPVSATAAASGGATGLGSDTGNHQQSVSAVIRSPPVLQPASSPSYWSPV